MKNNGGIPVKVKQKCLKTGCPMKKCSREKCISMATRYILNNGNCSAELSTILTLHNKEVCIQTKELYVLAIKNVFAHAKLNPLPNNPDI